MSAEDILGDRRQYHIIRPRHLYWAVLRHAYHWSYPQIGDYVGREHTSVMRGVQQVPMEVVSDLLRTSEEGR